MFFNKKKKNKAERIALPILSKDVYERCNDVPSKIPYNETIYAYDSPSTMQAMAISSLCGARDLKDIKEAVFIYIDDEFIKWAEELKMTVNSNSIGQYAAYILSSPNADNTIKRLWEKNIKEDYVLNFLFFNLKDKTNPNASKFKLKRINTASFIEAFKEKIGECWISPILFSQDDVVNYAKRLKDVGEASLENKKIRLGILDQDTCVINGNVALLPFIQKMAVPEYTINLKEIKELTSKNVEINDGTGLLKTTFFPETLMNAIATAGETDNVIVTPIANYSMPEFILDSLRIEVNEN